MDIARGDRGEKKRARLIFAGLAVVAVVTGLCYFKPASPSLSRSQAWIDSVHRGTLRFQVRGAGTLAPVDTRWIPATTDGRIERVVEQAGVAVHPDTLLLEISNPELQQAARDAELQLRAAEADLRTREYQIQRELLSQEATTAAARADHDEARLRANADAELAAAGLISALTAKFSHGKEEQLGVRMKAEEQRLELARRGRETDLANARAKVDQFRALVALKHEQLQSLQVRAGREGILQHVDVEAGQRVTAGATLAKVAAPYPLKAVIQVAEGQASQIAPGQRVEIDTHNAIVNGTVSRIDPAVRSGSVTIDVALPRELPGGTRPDLSVDALIEVDHATDVLYVARPVQAEPNGSVVLFKLDRDGNSATRQKVRAGRASYNAIEIRDGLAAGDRVVLSDTSAFDKFDRITISN